MTLVLHGPSYNPALPLIIPEKLAADINNELTTFWLPLSGGTATGPILLWRDPVDPMEAATKRYVQQSGARIGSSPPGDVSAPLWWDNNSGQLFIEYNDGNSTQWVAANSIDASTLEGSFLPLTGGTVTGPLVMPNMPTSSTGLAPGTFWLNGGFVCVA